MSEPVLATEFANVVGHDLVKQVLARMIEEERLAQVLLFAGPPLVGKRSMAVCLAKRLLTLAKPRAKEGAAADAAASAPLESPKSPTAAAGEKPGWAAAWECDPLVHRRISRGVHLDFLRLQPEGGSKIIRIDQVRALQDWAWLSPSEGDRKIVLIFGADTISEEAANSFLKLLEEPPPRLLMILVSDYPHRLLDTVRSRCTAVHFHPLALSVLEGWLRERHGIEAGRARLIAGLAEGRPGLALQLFKENSLQARAPLLDELDVLRRHGFLALPGVAARCLRHAGGLKPALEGILVLLRDAILINATPAGEDYALGADLLERMRQVFGGLAPEALLSASEAVARGLDITRHLWIPSEPLVLENVLADVGTALRRPAA